MNEENKLENLSFESNSLENNIKDSKLNPNKEKSTKNFVVLLSLVLIVLFSSIFIIGYYLFFNNSQKAITPVETKMEVNSKKDKINIKELTEKRDFQIQIYVSDPSKGLIYLGDGVLIADNIIITSGEVVMGQVGKNYKTEDFIIKQYDKELKVESMLGDMVGDKTRGLWTLEIKDGFFQGYLTFPNNIFEIGEELNLISSRMESVKGQFESSPVSILQKFKIIGQVDDGVVYITDLNYSSYPNVIYDNTGSAVGITYISDSVGNSTVISGLRINNILSSRGKITEQSNKEQFGIIFEFSNLDKFKKEGMPVGLVVKELVKGGIADKAGIKEGDIILTLNNQIITDEESLNSFFSNLSVGEEVRIELIREEKKIGITLSLP